MLKLVSIFILGCCLAACTSSTNYAPVTDISTIEHIPKNGTYRVTPGETLYSIAWRYGLDYRYLANLNHIGPPFHVVSGQRIYLSVKSKRILNKSSQKYMRIEQQHIVPAHTHYPVYKIEPDSNTPVSLWQWPVYGPVVGFYSGLNKGINIGGHRGSPVYATAAGLVVYSGNGLRGYGNLIIIKHNSTYLSAYANNSVVLVREGQHVKSGQKIAEMGNSNAGRTMLHFEIRRNGQPVNPLHYLPIHS